MNYTLLGTVWCKKGKILQKRLTKGGAWIVKARYEDIKDVVVVFRAIIAPGGKGKNGSFGTAFSNIFLFSAPQFHISLPYFFLREISFLIQHFDWILKIGDSIYSYFCLLVLFFFWHFDMIYSYLKFFLVLIYTK